MRTILLKLAGPLQAYGTTSHFENRNTERYPSKSAIIGMIAASLGYRREEEEKIQSLNLLDFAVRIDQPGKILRDYQIAAKYKDNGSLDRTYVTNRYYLQDAVFVVAIGNEDEHWITIIEEALKKPYFQPFMGRRSNPLTADFFLQTNNLNALESLKKLPWQGAKWYQKKWIKSGKCRLEIYADQNLIQDAEGFMTRDLVLSFSSKQRKHKFRSVSKIEIELSLEHDALSALGG